MTDSSFARKYHKGSDPACSKGVISVFKAVRHDYSNMTVVAYSRFTPSKYQCLACDHTVALGYLTLYLVLLKLNAVKAFA